MLGLGAVDLGLELSIVLPALPALAVHYDASLIAVAWLATGFLLASVVAVPLVGRLGDLFGKRLMILGSLGAFAIGSLMCALTDWIGLAIAGRLVQGLGAAVAPLTYALVRDTVEPALLPRAIGIVVGAASTGGTLGFLLSGVLSTTSRPARSFGSCSRLLSLSRSRPSLWFPNRPSARESQSTSAAQSFSASVSSCSYSGSPREAPGAGCRWRSLGSSQRLLCCFRPSCSWNGGFGNHW